jgi:uncharacterized protein
MKVDQHVLVTGGTGFVGTRLRSLLVARGHWVSIATRTPGAQRGMHSGVDYVAWLPDLARYDSVIHLAGANLFGKRWSEAYKREIRSSRVDTTAKLVEAMAAAQRKPRVLVSASAVGIYGDQGPSPLQETAKHGDDFLAEVCEAWEREALAAEALGVRVVCLRFGVVLGRGDGALAKMLPPFKLGIGGPIGSGANYMSWIHLQDLCALVLRSVDDNALAGPVNAVAPGACTNKEFSKALGRALHRPAVLPVPTAALRLAFGEVASVLTSSQRCVPERALAAGFTFQFPQIDEALRDLVG